MLVRPQRYSSRRCKLSARSKHCSHKIVDQVMSLSSPTISKYPHYLTILFKYIVRSYIDSAASLCKNTASRMQNTALPNPNITFNAGHGNDQHDQK